MASCPPVFDMRDVPLLLNDFQSGRSGIASISAQVLVPLDGWTGSLNHDGIKHARVRHKVGTKQNANSKVGVYLRGKPRIYWLRE